MKKTYKTFTDPLKRTVIEPIEIVDEDEVYVYCAMPTGTTTKIYKVGISHIIHSSFEAAKEHILKNLKKEIEVHYELYKKATDQFVEVSLMDNTQQKEEI